MARLRERFRRGTPFLRAIVFLLLTPACGGGGGSGPTSPGEGIGGVSASVRMPDIHCNGSAPTVVEVDNRSSSEVLVSRIRVDGTPTSGQCASFGVRYPSDPPWVASPGSVLRLEFSPLPWCCGTGSGCCGRGPCAPADCTYRLDSVVETSVGDLTRTGTFTLSFDSSCRPC